MTTTAQLSRQDTLLDAVRAAQLASRSAEVDMLVGVVEFAAGHPPLDGADRCRVTVDTDIEGRSVSEPLNGEGVPEVSAFAVSRLGVTLGLSPGSVRGLVAEALELAHRLPDLYAQVQAGSAPVWQARRVARATLGLSRHAARFVDRHLHGLTGSIPVRSLDRLVVEAVARHDHARRAENARRASDPRGFQVELNQCDLLGQVPVRGVLDLPDAIALDAALGHAAQELTRQGSEESREVRRARALGDLAREHLTAAGQPQQSGVAVYDDATRTLTPIATDAGPATCSSGRGRVPRGSRRELMIHLHITDRELIRALRSAGSDRPVLGRSVLGRFEHARTGDLPITAETIRRWCGAVDTSIRVLPVLDLAARIHHDAYEIPERLREQVIARDHTCVYPGCHAPARACDIDHINPYDRAHPGRGGPTATENLAALCRHHHNLKTTGRVSYQMTAPGAFAWDVGTGQTFIRDRRGTRGAGEDSAGDDRAIRTADPRHPPDT